MSLVSEEGQVDPPHTRTTQPLRLPILLATDSEIASPVGEMPGTPLSLNPGSPVAERLAGTGTDKLNHTEEFDDEDGNNSQLDSEQLPEYMAAFAEEDLWQPTIGLENVS